MRATPMTNEEYLKNGGNKCPFCESTNIEKNTEVEVCPSNDIECSDCGKEWENTYTLSGYSTEEV